MRRHHCAWYVMAGVCPGMLSGERVILWPVLDFSPIMVVDSLSAASDPHRLNAFSGGLRPQGWPPVYCSRCTVTLGLDVGTDPELQLDRTGRLRGFLLILA